jgi:hypothetical protein
MRWYFHWLKYLQIWGNVTYNQITWNKLILVNKNWFNDFSVGCNSFTSLVKLIESDATLKEDSEKYEGEFESNEILNL